LNSEVIAETSLTASAERATTMATRAIQIKTDPDFYAPYKVAQAYRAGDLIFVSGQASIDDSGNIVGVGDFDAQARQTYGNLKRVLEAGGSSLSRIIKMNVYIKDMSNFPKILALRERYLTPPYPAETLVEISSLALPELEIEIEAVALADGEIVG
jgi:2-iminobutanoate/2-iminopropanoate deaminase